jgi:hypothetical protein
MKTVVKKNLYVPSAYEVSCDFDFDLHMNFRDYLFVGFYLVFVWPLLLFGKLVTLPVLLLFRKKEEEKRRELPQNPGNKVAVFFSKFF